MITISVEGTKLGYVSASDVSGQNLFSDPGIGPIDLAVGEDTRLAFFRGIILDFELTPSWLVWQRPMDLIDLDRRVAAGDCIDADFEFSFRAEFRKSTCSTCGSRYEILALDAGWVYPEAADLMRKKITDKFRPLSCPSCGSSLRQLVAKIIRRTG